MAQTSTRIIRPSDYVSPTRRTVMGVIFLVMALGIWLIFSLSLTGDMKTTFVLYPGGSPVVVAQIGFFVPNQFWIYSHSLQLPLERTRLRKDLVDIQI